MIVVVLVYPIGLWLRETGIGPADVPSLSTAEAALQLSVEHYQQGRYPEAIQAALAALAENPDLPEAYNNIAVSQLQLGRYEEALQAVREALRLRPDSEMTRNNRTWIEQEKTAAAAAAVKRLMEEGVNCLYSKKDPEAAALRFRQALDLNPEHYGANYQYAAALQQAGHNEQARKQWIKALAMARAIRDEQTEALILPHLPPADRALNPRPRWSGPASLIGLLSQELEGVVSGSHRDLDGVAV